MIDSSQSNVISSMEKEHFVDDFFNAKYTTFQRTQTKFRRACIQLTLLNKQLGDMKERYSQAKADNFGCFRYNLRLKLAVIEGVRNMYYDYAYVYAKAEMVSELRHDLFGETVEIVASNTESEEDWWHADHVITSDNCSFWNHKTT